MLEKIDPQKFIELCKRELKKIKEVKPPEWAKFAKTGVHKKYPPQEDDWWYTRAASILRRIYLDGPIGVSRLRTYYGGRKDRGHKPEHFRKASGNVIRKILQQLESAKLIEKNKKGKRGRIISEEGRKFLARVISKVREWST